MSDEIKLVPIADIQSMAVAVAKSGLFGCKTTEEAMALMLVSQAEGMHPMNAVQEFHIIQGRPARKAEAILARFQKAGGSVEWVRYDDSEVIGKFSHPQGGTVTVKWSMQRATSIGLAGKDNWKKYPAAMMRSRCISEGVRTVFPSATGGMYTPEEVEAFSPPRDMGPAEIVKPAAPEITPYPADKFESLLPAWTKLIADGTKTAEDIIKTVKSKHALTAEQEQRIRSAGKKDEPGGTTTGQPSPPDEWGEAYDRQAAKENTNATA